MSSTGTTGYDLRGLLKNSLIEWEEHIAAVAVSAGCNWRCPYCHSWRYVTGVDELQPIDPEALFVLLEDQKGWIDGVVFSGGEPTLQPALPEVIRRAKEMGVAVKLHTNGSKPEVIEALLQKSLLDCLSLDFKAPLDERLLAVMSCNADMTVVDAVWRSFAAARSATIAKEYHTTLAPGVVDMAVLLEMADFLDGDGTWFLQQFENTDCLDPALAGSRRYSGAELDAMEALAKSRHPNVIVKRGKSA